MAQTVESPPASTGPDGSDDHRHGQRLRPRWSWQARVMLVLGVVYLAAAYWSFGRTNFSPGAVVDGFADMRRLADRMVPINFGELELIVRLSIETLFIAFIGTALAVLISVPLAFLAARNTSPNWALKRLSGAIIVATRAIPDLVFALIFVRAIGIGGTGSITAGILAIGISAIGMVAKLYADAVESIDEQLRDAVSATGAGRVQTLVTGVFPQLTPSFIGIALYRFDINFRSSTILGYVGAGGIGSLLREYLSGLRYERALGIVVVIIVLVLAVEFLSAAVRRQLLGGTDPFAHRRLSARLATRVRRWRTRSAMKAADADHLVELPGGTTTEQAGSDLTHLSTLVDGGASRADTAPRAVSGASSEPRLRPPWTGERIKLTLFGWGCLVFLVVSFVVTGLTPVDLVRHFADIAVVGTQLVPTDLSWLSDTVVSGIVETIAIAFAATTLGVLLSLPLAFFVAYNTSPNRWVYRLSRSFVVGVRAVPELIVAVLLVAAVGLGPFPGVMALTIGMVGFATKLYADAIEEVRPGPRYAVMSTGATRLQESVTAVVPQAFPAIVSISIYVFDIVLRASTILGIIGAGGIGFALLEATRLLRWDTVGGILLVMFVMVYLVERLSNWVQAQLR